MLLPGGSLTSIGVGAWILRHFGMPSHTIAQRQFDLSFLNTAVDALALVVFGAGLAIGLFAGSRNLLLTLLPAAIAAVGIGIMLLIARRAAVFAGRTRGDHPKLAGWIDSVAGPSETPSGLCFTVAGSEAWPARSDISDSTSSCCSVPCSRSTPIRYRASWSWAWRTSSVRSGHRFRCPAGSVPSEESRAC